jgi:hypothetical protein
MTTLHEFGIALGRPLHTSFGLSKSHNYSPPSYLVCVVTQVGPVEQGGCPGGLPPNNTLTVRATSHTRLKARDHYTSSTLIGGKGGAGPSSLHTTFEGPTEYISECKMDVKSTWISYMASNGSCSMITWTIFKNHLFEVGLPQNRKS